MQLKERTEPVDLIAMRYLNVRIELPAKDKFQLSNLEKGYAGEVMFDRMTETLAEDRYILDDLMLQVNNSFFQLDKVIISKEAIHIIDVKNYEGDYYLDSDKLYSVTNGREYKNPVIQLKRSETLFRQLLQNLKFNYLVQASITFINPEFTLYNAPMDQPIILPTQVNRFLRDLEKTPSKLDDSHQRLAQKLLTLHQDKNPFSILPEYAYDQLEKGLHCEECGSFNTIIKNYNLVCSKCGKSERIEQAVLRNIEEIKVLFPEMKMTTQIVHDWCQAKISKKTISRVLKKNYTITGKTSDTYYE